MFRSEHGNINKESVKSFPAGHFKPDQKWTMKPTDESSASTLHPYVWNLVTMCNLAQCGVFWQMTRFVSGRVWSIEATDRRFGISWSSSLNVISLFPLQSVTQLNTFIRDH